MRMNFDLFTIRGNIYKKLIRQLCRISDSIHFTCDREYTIDEGISELEGLCEQVAVPADVRQWCTGDVAGYKVDDYMVQYLFTYENLNELLGDRLSTENKTIFFYKQGRQIAHIYSDLQKNMYIETDHQGIIKEFLPLSRSSM